MTAQATLLPGGSVEMRFDGSTTLRDAVVALSPGATSGFAPVDLSAAGSSTAGGAAAVGERFSTERSIDLVGAAHAFYAEFGDDYDQLVFWTDTRATDADTFAYSTPVKNAIRGIGSELVDDSASYGSAGRLANVVLMDALSKYPADPNARVNGENTAMSLVAHETGHRWGARLRFRDGGGTSDALLGRQLAHWSFFADSDASVLEGNEIQDQGGSFRTLAPDLRYSPFDLYAMGALPEVGRGAGLLRRDARRHGPDEPEPGPRERAALGRQHDGHPARRDDRPGHRRDGRPQSRRGQRAVPAPPGVDLRDERRAQRRRRLDRQAGQLPPGVRGVFSRTRPAAA